LNSCIILTRNVTIIMMGVGIKLLTSLLSLTLPTQPSRPALYPCSIDLIYAIRCHKIMSTNPSSTEKNIENVRSNDVTEIQTLTPTLVCVCVCFCV